MKEFQVTVERHSSCTVIFKAEDDEEARTIAKKLGSILSPYCPTMPPTPGQVCQRKIKDSCSSGRHHVSLSEHRAGRFQRNVEIYPEIRRANGMIGQ